MTVNIDETTETSDKMEEQSVEATSSEEATTKESEPEPIGSVGLGYTINADNISCTITGRGTCTDTEIVIPNKIDGFTVTRIGNDAFYNCTGLTSITIPDSVTSIGWRAFYNCTDLRIITYQGTKAQWNAISKGTDWNEYTGKYTIHCTDGDLSK